ncbi:hypothetical protein ACFTZF_43855 [Streptomyces mirabilis]|uniref:hypothetical protein n=1 Tax=Streptomyces mirabilis TaxID=68239 RepID=UPI00362E32BC
MHGVGNPRVEAAEEGDEGGCEDAADDGGVDDDADGEAGGEDLDGQRAAGGGHTSSEPNTIAKTIKAATPARIVSTSTLLPLLDPPAAGTDTPVACTGSSPTRTRASDF